MLRFLFLIALLFFQCASKKDENIPKCEQINQETAELIHEFYLDNNHSHLDSALKYIDNYLEKCKEYELLFSLRKLSILSLKKEYSDALMFIETFEDKMFGDLSYFKTILLYRFKAMQAHSDGKIKNRDDYLDSIIKELDKFILDNKNEVDSLLQLDDIEDILSNSLSTTLMQYYYYKSILEGHEKVQSEIYSVFDKKEGNKDFYEMIITTFNEDFLIFTGM